MKKTLFVIAAAINVLVSTGDHTYALSLGLSSPNDLSNLTVGDTVTIDIVLSGLNAGDELEFLAADPFIPAAIFPGTPTITAATTPGGILPDTLGFFPVTAPATASASYNGSSQPPITTNGVFYSFDVTAQSLGTGTFSFPPMSVSAAGVDDTGSSLDDITVGPALPFNIFSVDPAIPEPSTSALALAAVCLTVRWRRSA